ncbi:hypothetical protein [Actinopolyspora mortivallis]|uniref:Uncharacterized protein n=1 Tax=Actinopolyspora mortivallis TaxID=33906 RepID=A0A2T0GZN3_ACTMO|nr:hypothetical protein [Actinopolyspora mortivallis]PRW64572.1 hypothetical protein CEP50_04250 [Actinopolyspora mortivallis]
MSLAQSTVPAVDLLVLALLVGFGLASAVFVPLLRRQHRHSPRTARRSGRARRARPDAAVAASPTVLARSTADQDGNVRPLPGEGTAEGAAHRADGHEDQGTWEEAERVFRSGTSRWQRRLERCTTEHTVRFGRTRARLSRVTRQLGIDDSTAG